MKVYDTVNKVELEATEKELVDIMVNGRQVDLILNEKKTDADGYLTTLELLSFFLFTEFLFSAVLLIS